MTRQSKFSFRRNARKLGLSALAAVTIGGYALSHQSASASSIIPLSSNAQITPIQQDSAVTYIDGEYQGDSVRAGRWGNVQVTAIIEGGQLTNITIQDYPHSRSTSDRISRAAIPYLMQEAIQVQSAEVDIVSGATPTSLAFVESLQSALDDAAVGAASSDAGASL